MSGRGSVWAAMVTLVICLPLFLILADALTSPEVTARYNAYQTGYTARTAEREQTRRVQAEEWNATLRTWGQNVAVAGSVLVVVAGVTGVLVVWQRERTKRHVVTQTHQTERALISAQRDVCIAYIAAFGGRAGELDGVRGVYLDASHEFVPWHVARRELAAARLLTVDT